MVCGPDYGVLGQNQVSGSRKQSGYSSLSEDLTIGYLERISFLAAENKRSGYYSHNEDLAIGYLDRISFLAAENNHVTTAKVKIRDGAWT